MTRSKRYADLLKQAESSVAYWSTPPLMEFSRSLDRLIKTKLPNQAALATKMGVSRAYINKVLRGDSNLTVTAMARIAMPLDAVVHIHVAERGVSVRWLEVIDGNDRSIDGNDKSAHIQFGAVPKEKPCREELPSSADVLRRVASFTG